MIDRSLIAALLFLAACGPAESPPAPPPAGDGAAAEADAPASSTAAGEDPYLWLEEVQGERALAWVEEQNAASAAEFAGSDLFQDIHDETLAILEAKDRLTDGTQRGDWLYNFRRGKEHKRGVYRRTPMDAFLAGKPEWELLLDVDALSAAEGRSWVFKGIELRRSDYQRGLIRLSDGGGDAVVIREFDLASRTFVEDGFALPEAKSSMDWIDDDTVHVRTDFGEGSLTESGYARIVKVWSRGTALTEARTVFEASTESVSAHGWREHYGDGVTLDWIEDGRTFYTGDRYLRDGDQLRRLPLPETVEIRSYYDGLLLFSLMEDWEVGGATHVAGTVLSIPLTDLLAGGKEFGVFFEPSETVALQSIRRTRSYLLVQVMDNVRDRLYRYQRKDGAWSREEIAFEGRGTIRTSNIDVDRDTFHLTYRSFLQPATLYSIDATTLGRRVIEEAPARFDAAPFESAQWFATSKDGTRVPYYIIKRKDLVADGSHPTLLYGYGGFRISRRPFYLGAIGKNWLERGGVYVVANIRGGGEFGPKWHAAALRENRHKAFEDFESVAEDLVVRKITEPKRLGIRGGSNGGLLVGACLTRRPELFGAVVCQVPLLDMKRYDKLLAGASWVAEYGDPDVPGDWEFIKTYSPYQNVAEDADYPRVLFTTSTKDDRVHPGHARKMVARMKEAGHDVVYYENTEGGHAGAADAKQRAYGNAMIYTYLLNELTETAE